MNTSIVAIGNPELLLIILAALFLIGVAVTFLQLQRGVKTRSVRGRGERNASKWGGSGVDSSPLTLRDEKRPSHRDRELVTVRVKERLSLTDREPLSPPDRERIIPSEKEPLALPNREHPPSTGDKMHAGSSCPSCKRESALRFISEEILECEYCGRTVKWVGKVSSSASGNSLGDLIGSMLTSKDYGSSGDGDGDGDGGD